MKLWILNTFFQKELRFLFDEAKIEGSKDAFSKAHEDIRETMQDDLDKKAQELSIKKLESLLTGLDMSKVVTLSKTGFVLINGERVDDARLQNLKSEAEALVRMDVWGLLHESPKQLAYQNLFVTSESMEDLRRGKATLFLLDQQRKILDILVRIKK